MRSCAFRTGNWLLVSTSRGGSDDDDANGHLKNRSLACLANRYGTDLTSMIKRLEMIFFSARTAWSCAPERAAFEEWLYVTLFC